MDYLHLINANVYLTNILLLPSIVFSYLIINHIHTWEDTNQIHSSIYASIWFIVMCIFIIGGCYIKYTSFIHVYRIQYLSKYW